MKDSKRSGLSHVKKVECDYCKREIKTGFRITSMGMVHKECLKKINQKSNFARIGGRSNISEKKLNLGCGNNIKEGYVNLDKTGLKGVNVVFDMENFPLPFEDDSFDEVYCSHVLEHVSNFFRLMDELHRILKPDGKIIIKTPFYSAWGMYNDPTHIRFFSPFTFDYFDKNHGFRHQLPCQKNFKVVYKKINYGKGKSSILNPIMNPIINLNKALYCRFFSWILPASELVFVLEKE